MSYKVCIFAVERALVSESDLLQALTKTCHTLADIGDMPANTYALLGKKKLCPELHCFMFLGTWVDDEPNCFISREFLEEELLNYLPQLIVMVYNDQRGVFLFKRYNPALDFALMTNAHQWSCVKGEITVEFPQKEFSNVQLEALLAKAQTDESSLSDKEYKAIAEYHNATSIATSQFYPKTKVRSLISCSADSYDAWALSKNHKVLKQAEADKNWEEEYLPGYIYGYPYEHEWYQFKLEDDY